MSSYFMDADQLIHWFLSEKRDFPGVKLPIPMPFGYRK